MFSLPALPWPALAFVAVAATVLGLGVTSLVRLGLERAGKVAPPSRGERVVRAVVLFAAAGGVACVVYGVTIEPNWLAVTHTRIESPRWPA